MHCQKEGGGWNNTSIAEYLNVPVTLVEHYFRKDKCFSIPSPEAWIKLKKLLNITETKFDESIMTFIEKSGVYEKANRLYGIDGIAPTITCVEDVKIIEVTNY